MILYAHDKQYFVQLLAQQQFNHNKIIYHLKDEIISKININSTERFGENHNLSKTDEIRILEYDTFNRIISCKCEYQNNNDYKNNGYNTDILHKQNMSENSVYEVKTEDINLEMEEEPSLQYMNKSPRSVSSSKIFI